MNAARSSWFRPSDQGLSNGGNGVRLLLEIDVGEGVGVADDEADIRRFDGPKVAVSAENSTSVRS